MNRRRRKFLHLPEISGLVCCACFGGICQKALMVMLRTVWCVCGECIVLWFLDGAHCCKSTITDIWLGKSSYEKNWVWFSFFLVLLVRHDSYFLLIFSLEFWSGLFLGIVWPICYTERTFRCYAEVDRDQTLLCILRAFESQTVMVSFTWNPVHKGHIHTL